MHGLLFFFQAEDGIRDRTVTGVQTCALPILLSFAVQPTSTVAGAVLSPPVTARIFDRFGNFVFNDNSDIITMSIGRSEERRVGKECRSRWSRDNVKITRKQLESCKGHGKTAS